MTPAERRAINERKGSEEIRAWVSARYSSDLIKTEVPLEPPRHPRLVDHLAEGQRCSVRHRTDPPTHVRRSLGVAVTPAIQMNETSLDARNWTQTLRRYRKANAVRGSYELAITLTPFALAWGLSLFAWANGHLWSYGLLILAAAGLLVRLFMIQHDCGHGSFFPHRGANYWLGRVISVVTLTPFDHWRRSHAAHHAASGNLERRGIGDVLTLTVPEYLSRSGAGRLRYRL